MHVSHLHLLLCPNSHQHLCITSQHCVIETVFSLSNTGQEKETCTIFNLCCVAVVAPHKISDRQVKKLQRSADGELHITGNQQLQLF